MTKKLKIRRDRQCKLRYKNWHIETGLIKNSPHPVNTVYLCLTDIPKKGQPQELHLTDDEAMAIVHALSHSVWVSLQRQSSKNKRK